MADITRPRSHYRPEKKKSSLSDKLRSGNELKSSIPKPTPYVRSSSARPVVSSSFHSQPSRPSRIPVPVFRSSDRGKTSASIQYDGTTNTQRNIHPSLGKQRPFLLGPKQRTQINPAPRSLSPRLDLPIRPKTASLSKSPYANVKAKVDSKLPNVQRVKKELSPTNASLKSNETNAKEHKNPSKETNASEGSMSTEEKPPSNEELLEKQKQLLNIYSELCKLQPTKDLQPLEREICRLMQNKAVDQLEGLSRESSFLRGEEFLSAFEKQMREVSDSWISLLCDSLPCTDSETDTDPRQQLYHCLSSLQTEGEPLQNRLEKIEEEWLSVMTVVMHSTMALSKEHADLKDKHFRLEKTQDQIHFELKEELAILGQENKELDKKYVLTVDKYNQERARVEQQEKHKLTINKDMGEVKRIMKYVEGRCAEWEGKVKKMEASCRTLEVAIRNKEVALEREGKQQRELQSRLAEAKENIGRLEFKLKGADQARTLSEKRFEESEAELNSVKASAEENLQKRNELVEELSSKTKKLNELETELDLMRSYLGNPSVSQPTKDDGSVHAEDLTKDINQRDLLIQELKKKLAHLESTLKESLAKEEMLTRQITDLQRKPNETEMVLRNQIKDLHYTVKDLTEEKADLEKIIVQKTLELDQRDLLMQEHSQVLKAKDELLPLIQSKHRNEKECVERLSAIVFEHEKTFYSQAIDKLSNKENNNVDDEPMNGTVEGRYAMDPQMVEKELGFRQEKMSELFSLLEHKQMELMRLERRLQDLQGQQTVRHNNGNVTVQRANNMRRELNDRQSKSRGFFSLFSSPDVPSY